jgi:hypothetical protein
MEEVKIEEEATFSSSAGPGPRYYCHFLAEFQSIIAHAFPHSYPAGLRMMKARQMHRKKRAGGARSSRDGDEYDDFDYMPRGETPIIYDTGFYDDFEDDFDAGQE